MGSSKKTYVSSQTFPLGGEYEDRMQFLKTTVVGAVMNGSSKNSMSDSIVGSYLNGPGIKLKSFGSWLERTNYWGVLGQGKSYITGINSINPEVISKYIIVSSNEEVNITEAEIGYPTAEVFVMRYMLQNYPDFAEYLLLDEEEQDKIIFSIELPNNTNNLPKDKAYVTYKDESFFVPFLVNNSSLYLYALYNIYINTDKHYYFYGEEEIVREEEYELIRDTTSSMHIPYKVETVLIKFNDGSEKIETIKEYEPKIKVITGDKYYISGDRNIEEKYKEFVKENIEEELLEPIEEIIINENEEEETIIIGYRYRVIKTRQINREDNVFTVTAIGEDKSRVKTDVFLYKEGEGIKELDELFYGSSSSGKYPFYPVMPVRVGHSTIGPNHWGSIYNANSKGYKKLTEQKYDKLRKDINSSSGLGDIATGFMYFGTAMNTKDPSAHEYIFKFFDHYFKLSRELPDTETWLEYNRKVSSMLRAAWQSYVSCVNYNMKAPMEHMQRRCTLPHISVKFAPIKYYGIWNSNMGRLGYHIGFTWEGQSKKTGKGRYRNLRPGQYIIENGGNTSYSTGYGMQNQHIWEGNEPNLYWVVAKGTKRVHIYKATHQIDEDNWEQLLIYNAQTQNVIRDGKGVYSSPFDHNEGSNESACILPLNKEILRQMSLKNLTQFSIGTQYLTFTAWKTVKKKWYNKGIFKIVSVAISIAVSIYFTPAGGAMAGGLLGANASIGAMVGLSGTAGLIAGAIANSVAAMVVTSVISNAANKLFGNTLGGIVANIASFAVANFSFDSGFTLNMSEVFNGLLKADNILSLASSVGKGYLQYSQESKMGKLQELQKEIEAINNKSEELNKKMQDEFGKIGIIDPLDIIDPFSGFIEGESKDDFISRTLMLGSDVAEITFNLISNYPETQLNLSLN